MNLLSPSPKYVVAALVGLTLSSFVSLHAQTYSAVNDFSITNGNPNGVWSYGTLGSIFDPTPTTFTLFTDTSANRDYVGQEIWHNGGSIPDSAAVTANAGPNNPGMAPTTNPQFNNQLNLDGESFVADVRFTAPTTTTYDLSGFFQRNDTGAAGAPVTVSIVEDGVTTLFSASDLTVNGVANDFSLDDLLLVAGTTIDFSEAGTQPFDDSTGLAATITVVPEPSAYALFGFGLLIAVVSTYRRRQAVQSTPGAALLCS